MNAFTVVVLAAVAFESTLVVWLKTRQIRCVVAHRAEVPVRFRGRVPQESHERAAEYTVVRSRLALVQHGWIVLCLLLWTIAGGLAVLDAAWDSLDLPSLVSGLGMVGSAVVIISLLQQPLDYYEQFVVEQRFGFNRMTRRLFLSDLVKSITLELVLYLPLGALVLWLMGLGSWWWVPSWGALMLAILVMTWVAPTIIAPRFNKFRPLEDAALLERLQALLARCGFRSRGVFVMDGSKRSAHGNAYFTGLGTAKRIVFFDTLLHDLVPDEVEAVLAHELGHYRLHHVAKQVMITAIVSGAALAVLSLLAERDWFYHGLGIDNPSRQAALVLFLLTAPFFAAGARLPLSVISRRFEYEADEFAADHAQPAAMVSALVKLADENATTLTPDPLHSAFFDSHPPVSLRVARLEQRPASPPPG